MSGTGDLDRRTHKASPKREQDFRKRGDIGLSKDLTMVGTISGGTIALLSYSDFSAQMLTDLVRSHTAAISTLTVNSAFPGAVEALAWASAPVCVGSLAGYLTTGALQLGWPPALKKIEFDLSRIVDPNNIKQIFDLKAAGGRTLKSAAKVAFVAAVAVMALRQESNRFLYEPALSSGAIGVRLGEIVGRVALYCCAALATLAVIDLILSRRRVAVQMRMTIEEMKREMREMEGDPQIRRRRRVRMRELARRRLAVTVKTADVVLVNPTEYAVALRYDSREGNAPRVVAKGRKRVAEKIREIARKNGVPIIAQPPLARLLFKVVPEGKEIPAHLFHAVAEVLAYVYRLRKRQGGARPAPENRRALRLNPEGAQ